MEHDLNVLSDKVKKKLEFTREEELVIEILCDVEGESELYPRFEEFHLQNLLNQIKLKKKKGNKTYIVKESRPETEIKA